jgi:hypothetical protein
VRFLEKLNIKIGGDKSLSEFQELGGKMVVPVHYDVT